MNSTTNAIPQCQILRPEFVRPTESVLTLKTRLRLVLVATLIGFVPVVFTSPSVGNWVSQFGRRVVAVRMGAVSSIGRSALHDESTSEKVAAVGSAELAEKPGKTVSGNRQRFAFADVEMSASNNWTLPRLPSTASRFSAESSDMFVRPVTVGRISVRPTAVDRTAVEPKTATRTGRPTRSQSRSRPPSRVPPGRLNAN